MHAPHSFPVPCPSLSHISTHSSSPLAKRSLIFSLFHILAVELGSSALKRGAVIRGELQSPSFKAHQRKMRTDQGTHVRAFEAPKKIIGHLGKRGKGISPEMSLARTHNTY